MINFKDFFSKEKYYKMIIIKRKNKIIVKNEIIKAKNYEQAMNIGRQIADKYGYDSLLYLLSISKM